MLRVSQIVVPPDEGGGGDRIWFPRYVQDNGGGLVDAVRREIGGGDDPAARAGSGFDCLGNVAFVERVRPLVRDGLQGRR